jgi:hypothetical protein
MSQLCERRTKHYNPIWVRGSGGKKNSAPLMAHMAPHEGHDSGKGSRLFLLPSSLLEGKMSRWSKQLPTCPQRVTRR